MTVKPSYLTTGAQPRSCFVTIVCYVPHVKLLPAAFISSVAISLAVCLAQLQAAPDASPPSKTAPPSPDASPTPDAADPVQREYRKLLELDEAAQDEVDEWIRAEQEFRSAGGALPDATLRARVMQRLEPVRKAYDEFLLRHPNHVHAHIAYASFLGDLGEEPGAVEHLEKARELDPTNPAIWNNLAHIYSHGGPIDKSLRYFEKAIELKPDEPVYYQNLATMVFLFRPDAMEFYRCDEPAVFERSLNLYRKAIQLDPDNFVLASDYAQSYYGIRPPAILDPDAQLAAQQDLHRKAVDAWNHALRIASTDEQRQGVHLHLARIKINQQNFNEARSHLDAVQLDLLNSVKTRLLRNLEERAAQAPSPSTPSPSPPQP
jgi:tetratricopeptide (TPR) repeat protein